MKYFIGFDYVYWTVTSSLVNKNQTLKIDENFESRYVFTYLRHYHERSTAFPKLQWAG